MSRAVEEWVGKTDDSAIPPRVKLRIWQREDGRCYLTGKKIMVGDKFEYEHKIAFCNGGSNRESNIFLALSAAHKVKTAADRDEKAKVDRIAKKHRGLWPAPVRKMQSRPFPKRAQT